MLKKKKVSPLEGQESTDVNLKANDMEADEEIPVVGHTIEQEGVLVRRGKRNKVYLYPNSLLAMIDSIIPQGVGAKTIRTLIKKNYKGPLPLVCLSTIKRYIEERTPVLRDSFEGNFKALKKLATTNTKISQIRDDINLCGLDIKKHRNLLEAYITILHHRIEWLREVQIDTADPKFEKCLTDDIGACKGIVETILKLEGKLAGDDYTRMAILVFMDHLSPLIGQAYQDTNGVARMPVFVDNLKKRFMTIDYQSIHNETVTRMAKTHQISEAQ